MSKQNWGAEKQIDEIARLWEIGKTTPYKEEAAAAASYALISAFKYHALEREKAHRKKKKKSRAKVRQK